LDSFNAAQNLKCLYQREPSRGADLRFIDGLRALLILFTVIAHSLHMISVTPIAPIAAFANYPAHYVREQKLLGSAANISDKFHFMMGLFFVMSGFVVTYTQLRANNVARVDPFGLFVAIRWVRMMPSIVGVMCMTMIAAKVGSGPLFHERIIKFYSGPCYDYWWTHLLLINNFWLVDKLVRIRDL